MESTPATVDIGFASPKEYFPLLELPTELLLSVFDYLDSDTVINVLSKVCKYLANIASDDMIWKIRIHKRWAGKRYPAISGTGYFDWKKACIEREIEYKKWKDPSGTLHRTDIMFNAGVDAVHFTQHNHMVIGLRDHTLISMNLEAIPYHEDHSDIPTEASAGIPVLNAAAYKLKDSTVFENSAHKGWVWTINSDTDKLCSGGWDSKMMVWDYTGNQISSHRCLSAVLCSTMTGNEILAGTFNRTLATIDIRQKEPTSLVKVHSRAVLCMARTPNYIIVGSELKVINIFDKKSMKICNTAKLHSGYPRSMCLLGNTMYIGSSTGQMHLYEFDECRGALTFVETFGDCHTQEVRSIRQTLGSVLSASKDGICRVWEPSSNPAVMQSMEMAGEISAMDYRNDCLALGVAPANISLYRRRPSDSLS